MSDIPIVCPSAGRSHKVLTKRIIPEGLILCVPEAEAGLYEKHNPTCEIVAHPDSIIGLAPKRQWIIERWPSVFMVDDDITHVADAGRGEGELPAVDVGVVDLGQDLHDVVLDLPPGVVALEPGVGPDPPLVVPDAVLG